VRNCNWSFCSQVHISIKTCRGLISLQLVFQRIVLCTLISQPELFLPTYIRIILFLSQCSEINIVIKRNGSNFSCFLHYLISQALWLFLKLTYCCSYTHAQTIPLEEMKLEGKIRKIYSVVLDSAMTFSFK